MQIRFGLAALVALSACGRSSLIRFDDGCPAGKVCHNDLGTDGGFDGGIDGSPGDLPPPDILPPPFDIKPPDILPPPSDILPPPFDIKPPPPDGGCRLTETCGNGIDDDCNGLTDCKDPACSSTPSCIKPKEICDNGKDDDGNGLIDCMDPACFGNKACIVPGVEICNNGIDDDADGLIDCADPDCKTSPVCKPPPGPEICNNGIDDNGNGLVDCADPQCVTFPACIVADCAPDVDFGAIAHNGASVTKTMNTVGATRSFQTCATPGGMAIVGTFTLSSATDVRADFTQASGGAHVVSLFRAGTNQACDQNPVNCWNVGQAATGTHSYAALAAGTYYIIVQSYPSTESSTTLTLSTAPITKTEICNNGIDDDGNGLIDCADLACATAPNCINNQCNADINLGTLVVGAAAKNATVVTSTSQNRYHPTCAGTSTGKDVVVEFTLAETAQVNVQWTQTGDHVFSIFQFPPPGSKCDTTQQSCYYPGGVGGGDVIFSARPPGTYVFIFKAIASGDEGTINIAVSAVANRSTEICNNGIDDDGDGLVDCQDPDCFGVPGCAAPACNPDVDFGDYVWGTSHSAMLDTSSAQNLYNTSCSKGTGKERVVRLNVTEPMALGFSCTETGSHVLQLAAQLMPLDPCDASLINCADPSILPFGCNFAMPNVQPGRYNIIIDAFQAGSEGTVNLTVTGIQEKVLEICNNGIDDDGDGFTDCNDLKCVTSPLCKTLACRPDQNLGVLPLDGSMQSVVVQTTGAGDDQKSTSCVTAPGGQDAVIDFEVPGTADVTMDWAQVGTHAFDLYTDDSTLLACDAGTSILCTPSSTSTGSVTWTKLAAGKYHLVVDAMKPGQEGGVVVQISGVLSP
jgi:hypothetical protein